METNASRRHQVHVICFFLGLVLMGFAPARAGARKSSGSAAKEVQLDEPGKPPDIPSAGEAVGQAEDVARERMGSAVETWRRALRSLTARPTPGWVLCGSLVLAGAGFLLCGWRLINSMFVFLSTAAGAGTGAYMALQACVLVNPGADGTGKATCLVLGAAFGITLFLGTALRARPISRMLVAAAPFMVLSASVFPSSPPHAIIVAVGGLGMGLAAAFRQRSTVTVSSAMFGALILVFSGGMFVYLLRSQAAHRWFDAVVDHPLLLALGVVLLIFIGTDIQLMLSKSKAD